MKKNRLIKLLILILVLLIVSFKLESQVFTSFSLDPNMAMGWGVTNKSGLNHKTNVGYRINRFELSSCYEGYKDINFDKVSLNIEYETKQLSYLSCSFNVGYGYVFRDYGDWFKSYNIGIKLRFKINKHIKWYIGWVADGRTDLSGNPDGHLKLPNTNLKSVISSRIGIICYLKPL